MYLKKTLFLIILIYLYSCGGGGQSQNNGAINDYKEEIPVYKTSDGKEFKLLKKEDIELDIKYSELISKFEEKNIKNKGEIYDTGDLPEKVFLKDIQTSIKNQSGRGTCVSFAVAAGIEAIYKRDHEIYLNLSEQFINHLQKMMHYRRNVNLPITETMLGNWGGSNVAYLANLLTYYVTVPENEDYITYGCFEKTDEESSEDSSYEDNPKFTWEGYKNKNPSYKQKVFNDFNLYQDGVFSNRLESYGIYTLEDSKRRFKFPLKYGFLCEGEDITYYFLFSNIDRRMYGISVKRTAKAYQRRDLNWYKRHLANNNVIVFGTTLNPAEFKNGVWTPKRPYDIPERDGGHAMLIVGYDDSKNAFIVKNSWGVVMLVDKDGDPIFDSEGRRKFKGRPVEADEDSDGFILMDYKWASEGLIHSAVVIEKVLNPDFFNDKDIPAVSMIGRWELHFGSESDTGEPTMKSAGLLDIYHIPNSMSLFFGSADKRIGTFFDNDNNGFRVNGSYRSYFYLDKNYGLTFYFNRDNPDLKPDAGEEGRIFKGYFSKNKKWIAGYYTDENDGKKYGFLAFKDFLNCTLSENSCFKYNFRRHPVEISNDTFIGKWSLIDGSDESTVLHFDNYVEEGDYRIYSGYESNADIAPDGSVNFITEKNYRLKIKISEPESVEIVYTIKKIDSELITEETVTYTGYTFKKNPHRISGYYLKEGIKYPFYTERVGPPPLKVKILKPVLTYNYYGEITSPYISLEAELLNEEYYGLSSNYGILWKFGDIFIGKGLRLDVTLPYTNEYTSLTACLTKSSECEFLDPKSTIFVKIVNYPPVLNITSPPDESTFCAEQNINFRVDISDPNGERIDESKIHWIFDPIGEKYGRTVTGRFLNDGSYLVTVSYADLGNSIGEDQITVNIETCPDIPPNITITSPENGTYIPEPDRRYSDNTEDITIPVSFTVSDPEDGNIDSSKISWMLYIPDLDYTIVGVYNEYQICAEPIPPLGCGRYITIKEVKFERVPSCKDATLKASVFDSSGNFSEDSVFLKKRPGCNLI